MWINSVLGEGPPEGFLSSSGRNEALSVGILLDKGLRGPFPSSSSLDLFLRRVAVVTGLAVVPSLAAYGHPSLDQAKRYVQRRWVNATPEPKGKQPSSIRSRHLERAPLFAVLFQLVAQETERRICPVSLLKLSRALAGRRNPRLDEIGEGPVGQALRSMDCFDGSGAMQAWTCSKPREGKGKKREKKYNVSPER